jgi:hypothetical protein
MKCFILVLYSDLIAKNNNNTNTMNNIPLEIFSHKYTPYLSHKDDSDTAQPPVGPSLLHPDDYHLDTRELPADGPEILVTAIHQWYHLPCQTPACGSQHSGGHNNKINMMVYSPALIPML